MKKNQINRDYVEIILSKREVFLICNCIDEVWNRLSESELQAIMKVEPSYLEEMSDYFLEILEEMKGM